MSFVSLMSTLCDWAAEAALVVSRGYPEAVINACDRTLYRTADGEYWERPPAGTCGAFMSVPRAEGQEIEHQLTRRTLTKADADFMAAAQRAMSGYEQVDSSDLSGKDLPRKSFPAKSFHGKTLPPSFGGREFFIEDRMPRLSHAEMERRITARILAMLDDKDLRGQIMRSAGVERSRFPLGEVRDGIADVFSNVSHAMDHFIGEVERFFTNLPYLCLGNDPGDAVFAGVAYLRGTPEARVAYRPDGDTAQYYISQGLNECASAAILNAQIFAGAPFSPDKTFLTALHGRVMKLCGSTDGRIDMFVLEEAVRSGRVPGLSMEEFSFDDLDSALESREPVVAIVPFFMGHAVAVVGKGTQEDTYRVIDTISGLEQELTSYEIQGVWKFKLTNADAFRKWVRRG